MRIAVFLPLLLPLLAAWGATPLAHRVPPRLATWLLTAAAAVLAGCSTVALALLAGTAALRIPLLADLERYSLSVVARDDPASIWVALAAGTLLTAATLAVGRVATRRARAVFATHRHTRALPGSDELVVVPDPAPEAYAAPGRPGRIVVSTAMLDALSPAEQDALIAHERSHLAHHHYRFLAAVHLAAALNPVLIPVARTVGYTVERWADEDAALAVGDRPVVAHAVGRAALAGRATAAPSARPALGLGITPALPRHAGDVPRRVAALLTTPLLTVRRGWLLVAVGVVLLAALGTLEAQQDFEALLELARHAVTR
ncbi:M56 family metallopeptidase [Actinomycetospora sp. TBRC 11914]|uniref:M56 family metallopeptidase n=1 Tax=Actinomycetospora sp. TBRC 11914 TaxID=2729387 RepID=UPI00145EEC38|nr:M56 family metallopeptidase [Actinomycetospora sp. TBRC 11914]NMO90247.1 M56 family metallopeptidase [Actinomycetospora sp. TBRC 11914]